MDIYTEENADKIIEYWEPFVIGKNLIIAGETFPIVGLDKEKKNKGYAVMVDTNTPHTGELIKSLYDLMLVEEIKEFDWVLCEPKKK